MCWQTFRNHNPCRCQSVEWIRGQEPRLEFRTRGVWARTSSDKAMKSEVTFTSAGMNLIFVCSSRTWSQGEGSLKFMAKRKRMEHLIGKEGNSFPKLGRCLWGKILVHKSHQNHSWMVYPPPQSKHLLNNVSHITMVIFSLRFDVLDSVPNALIR